MASSARIGSPGNGCRARSTISGLIRKTCQWDAAVMRVAPPVSGVRFRRLAERDGSQQHAVAFNQRQVGGNDHIPTLPGSLGPANLTLHRAATQVRLEPLECVARQARPRRPDNATRITLALLSRVLAPHCGGTRLKLGLTVSPRTVRRYLPRNRRPPGGRSTHSWTTVLHNHAGAVLACEFIVVATATFQRSYVFVILDIATRRILHWNVTAHPTA